tara:strand:- start:252 stop:572 length:321 start_codon:yes stop_codon:yes gene_type:complete
MSDILEIKGALKVLGETQEFSGGFRKRELVITTEGDYPQDIKFEVVKDKCELLDKLSLGQVIKIAFNLRGNEHNGKYYNNLVAWKIEAVGSAPQQSQADSGDEIPF